MATPRVGIAFSWPDRLERSVWVVVDPRDVVTGQRVRVPVEARLRDVPAAPIAGLSGVYCFTDLGLPAGTYVVQVRPGRADRVLYFDGETPFTLAPVPVAGQPLNRNLVRVELLPRPAYPFADVATLARGRLVRASDRTGIDGARIVLILDEVDKGQRGRTDERGEFVAFFPPEVPDSSDATATAGPKNLTFQLRFEIDSQPPLSTAQQTVREGNTISLEEIQFPGF
jgi:hypothetical protein